MSAATYALLADLLVVGHLAIVLFIVGGLVLILIGARRGWGWVRNPWFRAAHLLGIGIVAAEAWLGVDCPLTVLEAQWRLRAGQSPEAGSFVGRGVQWLLYYDAPPWVFTLAYSLFGALVAAAWWWVPPRRSR